MWNFSKSDSDSVFSSFTNAVNSFSNHFTLVRQGKEEEMNHSSPHDLIPVSTSSTTTTSSSDESFNAFMQQTIEYPVNPMSKPTRSGASSNKLGNGFNMTNQNQYRISSTKSNTTQTMNDQCSRQHFNLTGIKPSSKSLSSVTSSVNSSACAYMDKSFTSPKPKCYPNNTISYDYYLQHESPHLIPLNHQDTLPVVTHHTSKSPTLNNSKDSLSDSSSLNVCNSSSSLGGSIVSDDITIKASNHKVPLYISPRLSRMKGTLPPIADDVFEKDCKISFNEDVQVFIPSSKSNNQGTHKQGLVIYEDRATIQQKSVFQKSSERVKSILCISNQNSTTNGQKKQIDPLKPSSSSTQSPTRAPQSSNEDKLNQSLTPKRSGKQKPNVQYHNKNILLEDFQENILVGLPLRISNENDVNGVAPASKKTRNFVRKLQPNRKQKQNIEKRKELSTIQPNHKSNTITSKMNTSSTDTTTKKSKNSTFKRKANKQELENKWKDDAARKIHPIIQKLNDKDTTLPNDLVDDSVRGRFDGMDLLSLGSARQLSYLRSDQKRLAGQRYTLRSMVTDMLWSSCGQDSPEIIFEGYTEIGEDRWGIQVEQQDEKNNSLGHGNLSNPSEYTKRNERSISWNRISKGLKSSDYDDGSNFLSFYKDNDGAKNDSLFNCILEETEEIEVTSNSVQCNVSSFSSDIISFENDVQTTCPVDADYDIFLFNNMAQLNNIYDEAGSFLKEASMTDAVYMFDKIVRSMQARFSNNRNQHLLGSAYHNLGIVQMWAGLYEDALKSFDYAILVRRECLEPNHATVAVSLAKIGIAFFALERLDYALKAFQKALDIRQEISSKDHLEIAKIYNNIGAVYYQKGDNKNAMDYFIEAFKIQERCLRGKIKRAPLVYDSSMTLGNMGKVFLSVGEYDMARVVFKEALKLQTSTFSNDHNIVLSTLGNLAYTETKNQKLVKALQLHQQILKKQIQKFGTSNREVAETKGLMGVLYIQLEDFKSASKCLDDVLLWQLSNLDDHHPAIKNTIQMLDRLKSDPRGIS